MTLLLHIPYLALATGGIFLNGMLFWLIYRCTNDVTRTYNKLILIICLTDLLFSITSVLTEPVVTADHQHFVTVHTGFVWRLAADWLAPYEVGLMLPYYLCFYVHAYYLAVQFLMRYLIVCRKLKITLPIILFALAIATIFPIVITVHYATYSTYNVTETPEMTQMREEVMEKMKDFTDRKPIILIDQHLPEHRAFVNAHVATLLLVYVIIFTCMRKIQRTIGAMAALEKTKRTQQQISLVMNMQAMIPLFHVFATIAVQLCDSMPFGSYANISNMIMVCVDPLITMLLISSYRRLLFHTLRLRGSEHSTGAPIQTNQTENSGRVNTLPSNPNRPTV